MEIIFLRQAHKFIRKADKPLRNKIQLEVLKIKKEPRIGESLKQSLKGMLSHHFSFNGVQYQIAYQVVNNIIVVCIATRENFYRDLLR